MAVFEPFVEGWDFVETLGEGAYGEVRLAINRMTQEAVAVKIVNSDKLADNKDSLKKEVCIHKMLQDPHIIKLYGQRTEKDRIFLFLEYAPGGELFDKIEPDHGMPLAQAHKYFKQLINGLEYIHSKGVTHRDIKPENLLIDIEGNLKITDFGFSTIFKYKGKERMLERCCGTPPYVAPEVLKQREYKAEPADIWSCGIVLTAMLAGELPWDEPTVKCKEFSDWLNCRLINSPWNKIDTLSIGFLKKLLNPNPSKRCTMSQIKKDKWFMRSFSTHKNKSPRCSPMIDSPSLKRHNSTNDADGSLPKRSCPVNRISLSQPDPTIDHFDGCKDDKENVESSVDEPNNAFFSQPTNINDMLLSQIATTPGSSQNPFAHLAKRLTRFHITLSLEEAVKLLTTTLKETFLCKIASSKHQVRVSTTDRRKAILNYLVNFTEIGQSPLMVEFRLSKGDGIEFKRQFKSIKGLLQKYLE